MYHPTTRVLTILELLQAYPRLSGTQLANRLEVDVRTVRRYIVMLQDLGIPIEAEAGRYGGYTLRPGFKLPPLIFTNDEIVFLVLGLMNAHRLGVLEAAPAIESALAKIIRVLPASVAEYLQTLRNSVTLDRIEPNVLIEGTTLATLSLAAAHGQSVSLQYITDDTVTERVVDPYGVVNVERYWYTVGFCHLRQDIRIFRLDRIQNITREVGTFNRPTDFDCHAYVTQKIVAIPDQWDVLVLLHTSVAEVRRQIPTTMATLEETPQGTLFHTIIADLNRLARLLVTLDCTLVVQRPLELKTAFRQLAQQIHSFSETPD